MTTPRIPPHSLEAERAVLGCILLTRDALPQVADALEPGDFYRESHQAIYRAMLALDEAGRPVDQLTLADALKDNGQLDAAGGLAYLFELNEAVATAANVGHYASLVRDKALLRALITRCAEAQAQALESGEEPEALLQSVQDALYGLQGEKTAQQGLRPIRAELSGVGRRLFARIEGESMDGALLTGFYDLDRLTGGLRPGDLCIVAGRPGMGKTSFAMDIAREVSRGGLTPYISLEMGFGQCVERVLAQEARVDMRNLSQADTQEIVRAMGKLSERGMYFDDTGGLSVATIRHRVRRLAASGGAPLAAIFIDYLQLMASAGKYRNDNERVEEISRDLKGLAKHFEVPVIAVSQLNRAVEQRQDKRPQLSDIRSSGAIEQDADHIWFVHRPVVYDSGVEPRLAHVLVRKGRYGPTGDVEVNFDAIYTTFTNREHWERGGREW